MFAWANSRTSEEKGEGEEEEGGEGGSNRLVIAVANWDHDRATTAEAVIMRTKLAIVFQCSSILSAPC